MRVRPVTDRVAAGNTVVGLAIAGVLAFGDRISVVADLIEKADKAGFSREWTIPALITLFLVISSYYFLQAFAQRSQLKQPERLLIDKEDSRHLKGREQDIEDLGRLCDRHPLVFLDGESGSGKSALVAAGLTKWSTKESTRPLLIRCDLSGAPWDRGLESMLAKSVYRDAGEYRTPLAWTRPPTSETVFAELRRIEAAVQRKPLLAFDQFDDYQDAHREQFVRARGRELVPMDEFLLANGFWRAIGEGVVSGAWHCLFVTRNDQRAALDVMRFVEPKTYTLQRVPRNLIAPILDELTRPGKDGADVISNPDKGWTALREKLFDDLKSDDGGDILPIQLSIALQGLAALPALTIGAYGRKGGLPGLGREYIDREVDRVARGCKFDRSRVLKVLVELTDGERLKSRRKTSDELVRLLLQVPDGAQIPDAGRMNALRVLEALRDRRVLRSGVDADRSASGEWLLHHDQLARGIVKAERRSDRWNLVLAERAKRYRLASGLGQRRQALLPVLMQLRLAWERWGSRRQSAAHRGAARFRYREHAPYAAISAMHSAAFVLIAAGATAVSLHLVEKQRNDSIAMKLLTALSSDADRDLSGSQVSVLRAVERGGPDVAMLVLREVMAPHAQPNRAFADGQARRFRLAQGRVIHAFWRLDASPQSAAARVGQLNLNGQAARLTNHQLSLLVRTLEIGPVVAPQMVAEVSVSMVDRMTKDTTHGFEVAWLARELSALAGKGAKEADMARGALALVDRMVTEMDANAVESLARGLLALAGKGAKEADVAQGAQALVDRMVKDSTDTEPVASLAQVLSALAGKGAKEADVARGALALVDRMVKDSTDAEAVASLARGLSALAGKGAKETDVATGAQALVDRMVKDTADTNTLVSLAPRLSALAGKGANEADVARGTQALVDRMVKDTTDSFTVGLLAAGLSALAGKGANEAAVARGTLALVDRIAKDSANAKAVASLAPGLSALAGKGAKEADMAPWAQALIDRLAKHTDTDRVEAFARFAQVLSPLAGKGPMETDVARMSQAVVDLIAKDTTDARAVAWLMQGLSTLAGRGAKESDVAPWAQALADRMVKDTTDADTVESLARGLSALAGKGAKEMDVARWAQALVDRMTTERQNDRAMGALANAVTYLAAAYERIDLSKPLGHALAACHTVGNPKWSALADFWFGSGAIGFLDPDLGALAGSADSPERVVVPLSRLALHDLLSALKSPCGAPD